MSRTLYHISAPCDKLLSDVNIIYDLIVMVELDEDLIDAEELLLIYNSHDLVLSVRNPLFQ